MAPPRVSIGLPVYNGERYLPACLDALLRQEFGDFELVISDNASTDATAEICRAYVKDDKRLRYFRNPTNIGASANFRRVFALSRGRYFKWAAYDDIHLPKFVGRCVELLDRAPPTVALVAPWAEIIDDQGQVVRAEVPERLCTTRPHAHQRLADVLHAVRWSTAQYGLFRPELLQRTRLIDSFFASDRVLLLEIALLGEIREVPEVLFQQRDHATKSTAANASSKQLIRWFDPRLKGRRSSLLRKRLTIEYVRSITRASLPPAEKMRCYAAWFACERPRLLQKLRNSLALRTRLRDTAQSVRHRFSY